MMSFYVYKKYTNAQLFCWWYICVTLYDIVIYTALFIYYVYDLQFIRSYYIPYYISLYPNNVIFVNTPSLTVKGRKEAKLCHKNVDQMHRGTERRKKFFYDLGNKRKV
jgi:hypothetical protein